jgi:hypothetical protein
MVVSFVNFIYKNKGAEFGLWALVC